MTRVLVSRRLLGVALAVTIGASGACKDPNPTFVFDASVDAATGGKGGAGGGGGAGGAGGAKGTGGATGTGGFSQGTGGFFQLGTGGSFHASGGTSGSGGAQGPGGSVGTGGAQGSGGTSGTGGAQGMGGTPGTGGVQATGGLTGNGGSAGVGEGGGNGGTAGAAGAGGGGGQTVLDPAKLLAAADFEINSAGAQNAFNDCDPTKLTANPNITDSNGNSWGPATLGNAAQKAAFANLLHAIFLTLGTADAPGPGPMGSVGLHGWPNLNPRLTGAATNQGNNGPGVHAVNGGLVGFGAAPSTILSGTLNGELVALYKAAALADGLVNSTGTALTASSSNTDFGFAIAPVTNNPKSAIGLADNIAQCALAISIGVDEDGDVLTNPTTFTRNLVEDL